eukprot:3742986-Rhodomonas_salina.1
MGGDTLFSLGSNPEAEALSSKNRLHIRGFARLDARIAIVNSRPAYLPQTVQVKRWAIEVQKESAQDALMQQAGRVHKQMKS